MTILATIKADQLTARKNGEQIRKDLLTTLIGDIDNALRKPNAGDESQVATATIKSFLKKVDEFLAVSKDEDKNATLQTEREILEAYLPQQLNSEQLIDLLSKEFNGNITNKSKGLMMKFLKDNYANRYDGRSAGAVVDELIAAHTG